MAVHSSPRLHLVVTEEIRDAAIPKDSGHCMYADAVRVACAEKGIDCAYVSVDLQTIRFTDRPAGKRYTYFMPRAGQVGLLNFDAGIKPEPHDFWIGRAQVTRASKNNPAKPPKVPSKQSAVTTAKGTAPVKVGGKTPPIGPLAFSDNVRIGRRREFGLRGMGR